MAGIVVGIFILLHGGVHLLYFGQSWRLFELQPGLLWPDGSWALSKILGEGATRRLASMACVAAAVGFLAGGIGILLGQAWWRPVAVVSAAFSAAIFLLFWDGKMQKLDRQGGVGLLIDVAIILVVYLI